MTVALAATTGYPAALRVGRLAGGRRIRAPAIRIARLLAGIVLTAARSAGGAISVNVLAWHVSDPVDTLGSWCSASRRPDWSCSASAVEHPEPAPFRASG